MSSPQSINKTSVLIPTINTDARMGSVFSRIFQIIFQTERIESDNSDKIVWDFSQCDQLHPFFICAASILKRQYKEKIVLQGINETLATHLESIHFDKHLLITGEENDDNIWNRYQNQPFLPICRFNPYDDTSTLAQELIQKAIHKQLGFEKRVVNVISLLLAELIDNITEHSRSKEGYIFCEKEEKGDSIHIMISDTGRSIYSSYASNNKFCDLLTINESSALIMAISGRSTKDLPDCENRGHGISKSIRMVVDGMGGEFFILSGSAFFRHDSNGEVIADLPGDIRWNGTTVLLKIPAQLPNNFNIYNYII